MDRNCLCKWLFVIFTCFAVSSFANEAIIGGSKASHINFRYHVSLRREDGVHFCGGGIIGDRFVMTAAQCVIKTNGDFDSRPLNVHCGTNNMADTEPPAAIHQVSKIYVPDDYLPFFITPVSDIAVLKLKVPLSLWSYSYMKNLILPPLKHSPYDGLIGVIAGYGWQWMRSCNDEGGYNDTFLRSAEATILSPDHPHYLPQIHAQRQISARIVQHDRNQQRGVCIGDGGSPLVINNTIIGILSRGPVGCTEEHFGATYTRVSHYMTFVRNARVDMITRFIRTIDLIR